jgi:2-dehydro-3-deoxyphosphogalactonate aldolase
MNPVADRLARCPFVAILRGIAPDEVDGVSDVLVELGFAVIEIPLNSPRPLVSLERLARRVPERVLVGAGTVLSDADVSAIAQAGGRLVVMPHASAPIVREAKRRGLAVIPGFATPTEAFAMIDAGADALKLFPADGSSPAALRSMRAVLPHGLPILPVGGIDEKCLSPWLKAGAAGFGIGSALYRPGDTAREVLARGRALLEAWSDLPKG